MVKAVLDNHPPLDRLYGDVLAAVVERPVASAEQLLTQYEFTGNFRLRTEALDGLRNLEARSVFGRTCFAVRRFVFGGSLREYAERIQVGAALIGDFERETESDPNVRQLKQTAAVFGAWTAERDVLKRELTAAPSDLVERKLGLLDGAIRCFLDRVYGDVMKSTHALYRSWYFEAAASGETPEPELKRKFDNRLRGTSVEFFTMMRDLKALKPDLPWDEPVKLWVTPELQRLRAANCFEATNSGRAPVLVLAEQIVQVAGHVPGGVGNFVSHESFTRRLHTRHLPDDPAVLKLPAVSDFFAKLSGEGRIHPEAAAGFAEMLIALPGGPAEDPRHTFRVRLERLDLLGVEVARALGIGGAHAKEVSRQVLRGDNHNLMPVAVVADMIAASPSAADKLVRQAIEFETSRRQAACGSGRTAAREHAASIVFCGKASETPENADEMRTAAVRRACAALDRLCDTLESVPGTMRHVDRNLSFEKRRAVFADEPRYILQAQLHALDLGKTVPPLARYAELLERAGVPLTKAREAAWQETLIKSLDANPSLKERMAAVLCARIDEAEPIAWQRAALERRMESRLRAFAELYGAEAPYRPRTRVDEAEFEQPSPAQLHSLAAQIPERNSSLRKDAVASYVGTATNGLVSAERAVVSNLRLMARDQTECSRIVAADAYLREAGSPQYGSELELSRLMTRRDALVSEKKSSSHPSEYLAELQLLFPGTTRREIELAVRRAVSGDPAVFGAK